MDWRNVTDPVGPLPRSVYWLRRGALVLAVVFVVAVIAVVANSGGKKKPTTAATTSPSASSTPTVSSPAPTAPTPTPTPSASTSSDPCPASGLSLTVQTSAKSYTTSSPVKLTAVLSTANGPCTASGGLTVTITSGEDRIWSSGDCAPSAGATTVLAAKGSAAATRTWTRTRSRPGCTVVSGDKTANAGSYRAVATWAGVTSAPYTFRLS